jgi:dihydrofolate synthase/folylpolyglutamate synthase
VEAARTLAENLAASGFAPETIAVCGMLRDKDIPGVMRELSPRITRWHLASLPGPRGASADELAAGLGGISQCDAEKFTSAESAFASAVERVEEGDKIVVFGSFHTVGEVMAWLKNNKTSKR